MGTRRMLTSLVQTGLAQYIAGEPISYRTSKRRNGHTVWRDETRLVILKANQGTGAAALFRSVSDVRNCQQFGRPRPHAA
jgi:hypothetical protein